MDFTVVGRNKHEIQVSGFTEIFGFLDLFQFYMTNNYF